MPSALVVGLCAAAAASFLTVLGFALARRLVGPALALPIAPALGWAVHSAAALPILPRDGQTRALTPTQVEQA